LKFSAIILAGGRAKRLGTFKPMVMLNNKPLISYVINCLLKIADQLIIVIKNDIQMKYLKNILFDIKNIEYVFDEDEDGILFAIKSGLKHCRNNVVFITGCDIPLINDKVVLHMVNEIFNSDCDAVVPRWKNGFIEPLYSVYKVNATFKALNRALNSNYRSVRNLLKFLKVKYLSAEMLEEMAGCPTFLNVNTFGDLKLAEKYLSTTTSFSP